MSLEQVNELASSKKVVGAKQTQRALEKGAAAKVYLGGDADKHVTNPLLELCKTKGVSVDASLSMAELGKTCGIAVSAAAVALLKEGK